MSKSRHHASLLIGKAEEAEKYLHSFALSLGVKLANNPDFFAFRADLFGIDEARQLSLVSSRKAIGDKKVFFIAPLKLTLEAQNALLKTFEDPSPDTYFLLAVREESLVLPTLRSRMQLVRLETHPYKLEYVRMFLALSLKERLSFAKEFADEEKDLPAFLDDLLSLLREKDANQVSVKRVYDVRRFANDTAVLPRLVLEHLALVL